MNLFSHYKFMRIETILRKFQELQDERKQLISDLKSIRSKNDNWRINIESDKRTSVKLLYDELKKVEKNITELENLKVQPYVAEDEDENEDENNDFFD